MKYAIFGDIHANLEGLQAILQDAEENGCNRYCCIGDIVGYNANPSECIQIVRELECPVVKGNHDEDCGNTYPLEGLNDLALTSLQWTREMLNEDDKFWLRELNYIKQVRDFTIVHSSLDSPQSWSYIKNIYEATTSMSYQSTQVCFFGHTHVPKIYVKSNQIIEEERKTLLVENGKKYFVNVGSCGQPRDEDWRASYCIFDLETHQIKLKRVEYDIRTTQEKILSYNLPEMLAERLEFGK